MADALIFRAVQTAAAARLIFIGDIHGCYEELLSLLQRVSLRPSDVVVSVGDVVNKGPEPARCVSLWRDRGYLAVRGNNELKLLARARPLLRLFARDEVLRDKDLLQYIASWPLVLDFPAQRIAAVHGGFLPDMHVHVEDVQREQEYLPELRWIRKKNGTWRSIPNDKKRKDDVLWAEKWKGDRFAVYGHTPVREPRFDARALGLDTGCVYGGSLTAAIYDDGEWATVSVPARRAYV